MLLSPSEGCASRGSPPVRPAGGHFHLLAQIKVTKAKCLNTIRPNFYVSFFPAVDCWRWLIPAAHVLKGRKRETTDQQRAVGPSLSAPAAAPPEVATSTTQIVFRHFALVTFICASK
jgi:hypothetical protein